MLLKKLAEYSERLGTAAQPLQRRTGPVLDQPGPGRAVSPTVQRQRGPVESENPPGTAPPPAPGAKSGRHSPASAG